MKEVKEAALDSGGGGRRVSAQRQDDATSLACMFDDSVEGL